MSNESDGQQEQPLEKRKKSEVGADGIGNDELGVPDFTGINKILEEAAAITAKAFESIAVNMRAQTSIIATTLSKLDFKELKKRKPLNWPENLGAIDINAVETIINKDGLPLVWVPRAKIFELVTQAPDRASRVNV